MLSHLEHLRIHSLGGCSTTETPADSTKRPEDEPPLSNGSPQPAGTGTEPRFDYSLPGEFHPSLHFRVMITRKRQTPLIGQPEGQQPTPLMELAVAGWSARLKLEQYNPSGSHKYRPTALVAANLRQRGIGRASEAVIVMPSSGNAARALAYCTTGMNVRIVVVTDVLSPREQHDSLRLYQHVDVEIIDDPDQTGSHVHARRRFVNDFCRKHPGAIVIDQYQNSLYALGYASLIREIETQCKSISAIFVPVGTAATILSLAKYKEAHGRHWKLFAVDARGSALFGRPNGKRTNSGYGNGAPTEWARLAGPALDAIIRVPDEAAIRACRWLSSNHRIHLGASSGATLAAFTWAALSQRVSIPEDGSPILVMPDGGHLYRSTVYSDEFLIRHGLADAVARAIPQQVPQTNNK